MNICTETYTPADRGPEIKAAVVYSLKTTLIIHMNIVVRIVVRGSLADLVK